MKLIPLALGIFIATPAFAEKGKTDWSQYGTPISVPSRTPDKSTKSETALDREIATFRKEHEAHNAVLINNSGGRGLDSDNRVIGSEALGRLVTPTEVIIIAEAMVADPIVKLYTSIERLPECAHTVRLLYTQSSDRSTSALLGYTIENPKGNYTKLVKYDGSTPWLDWITQSFKKDDAEQGAAANP